MTQVAPWVRDMTESILGGTPFKIGDRVEHPDGRTVEITDGQYWGTHGLSNFWYWREVLADGTLAELVEHGYGWRTQDHRAQAHQYKVTVPEGSSYSDPAIMARVAQHLKQLELNAEFDERGGIPKKEADAYTLITRDERAADLAPKVIKSHYGLTVRRG